MARTPPATPSRRALTVAIGLLTGLLLASPLHAGDPVSSAFGKAAKTASKTVSTAAKGAEKAVKGELKTAAADYASGDIDAATAVAQAVQSITTHRDAAEDAAFDAALGLATTGTMLLIDNGITDPSPDFQAGGRGVWDDFMWDVDAALDKTDGKLDKTFVKFMQSMAKGAKKLDEQIDIHYVLPEHGTGFWSVEAPAHSVAGGGGSDSGGDAVLEIQPSQVLIGVRFITTTQDDLLDLGIRWTPTTDIDVNLSSMAGESVDLPPVMTDTTGTATLDTGLSGLGLSNDSFLSIALRLDALDGADATVVLSEPRLLTVRTDAVDDALSDFGQQVKVEQKFYGQIGGFIAKDFGKQLNDLAKEVSQGNVTGMEALETGYCDMRSARSDIGFWFGLTTRTVIEGAAADLDGLGVAENEVPNDFLADACGLYADALKKWQKDNAKHEASVTSAYHKFVGKVLKSADKQGEALAVNYLAGRTRRINGSLLTVSDTPPVEETVARHIPDAILLVHEDGGEGPPTALHGEVTGQTVPEAGITSVATVTNTPDGTVVIGGLISDNGGTDKKPLPAVSQIPYLGQLFRLGKTGNKPLDLLILTTPRILTKTE